MKEQTEKDTINDKQQNTTNLLCPKACTVRATCPVELRPCTPAQHR